jgi:sortase A
VKRGTYAACAGLVLLLPGAGLLARAAYVRAKGALGVALIERALDGTLSDGRDRRPWSWADMHPVARLRVPRLDLERPVLSNATGSALAFGLGHVDGTAEPGAAGNCVIAGHRDSWAEFLQDLRAGDEVVVTTPGARSTYFVAETRVARHDDGAVAAGTGDERLTLVTCWPFSGWLHSPWRYVVVCARLPARHDHPARDAAAGVSRRLRREVVGLRMDDDRVADHVP